MDGRGLAQHEHRSLSFTWKSIGVRGDGLSSTCEEEKKWSKHTDPMVKLRTEVGGCAGQRILRDECKRYFKFPQVWEIFRFKVRKNTKVESQLGNL